MLRPFSNKRMSAWLVNRMVGNVTNDGPDLIEHAPVQALQLGDLYDLQNGKRDHVLVGLLPEGVPTKLGIRIHEVFLSASTLEHIQKVHPDITLFDLLLTPFAIKKGLLLHLAKKPSHVVLAFEDEDSQKRYCGTIKILKNGSEMYLLTFYRTHNNRFTASLLRGGTIVKTHD